MYKNIQILGFGPYYAAILYDLILENGIADTMQIFRNIDATADPVFLTIPFSIKINEAGNPVDSEFPCIFGVSGGGNKTSVFNYFNTTFNVGKKSYISILDKSSNIAGSVEIGNGCIVEQNVCISSQTNMLFGVTVKRSVNIGHHCVIEDFVDINPGATVAGKVKIGTRTTIGAGAVIIDGVSIGSDSVIGAGSVVTRDIPSKVIAYGNPCRVIRNIEQ